MLKKQIALSPVPATTIAELRQRVQDSWDNLSQDDIRHFNDRVNARMHVCVVAKGGTLCIDVTVWAPLTVTYVIWSEFVITYFYNDKLPVTTIFNIMNLSLMVLNFFGSVYILHTGN